VTKTTDLKLSITYMFPTVDEESGKYSNWNQRFLLAGKKA